MVVANSDYKQVYAVVHNVQADNGLHQIILGDNAVKAQNDEEERGYVVESYHIQHLSFLRPA